MNYFSLVFGFHVRDLLCFQYNLLLYVFMGNVAFFFRMDLTGEEKVVYASLMMLGADEDEGKDRDSKEKGGGGADDKKKRHEEAFTKMLFKHW